MAEKRAHPSLQPSTTPALQVVDVAAGLIFRDGKLLITQRRTDAHLGGLWEFPGGKREPNETFEECLVRELREELGIEVVVGELWGEQAPSRRAGLTPSRRILRPPAGNYSPRR